MTAGKNYEKKNKNKNNYMKNNQQKQFPPICVSDYKIDSKKTRFFIDIYSIQSLSLEFASIL